MFIEVNSESDLCVSVHLCRHRKVRNTRQHIQMSNNLSEATVNSSSKAQCFANSDRKLHFRNAVKWSTTNNCCRKWWAAASICISNFWCIFFYSAIRHKLTLQSCVLRSSSPAISFDRHFLTQSFSFRKNLQPKRLHFWQIQFFFGTIFRSHTFLHLTLWQIS